MIFANVRELKNKTSQLLKATREGNDVIITYRGRPCAVIQPLIDEKMEEYILNHPKIRELFQKDYDEYKKIGGKNLNDFIEEIEAGNEQ